MCRRISPRASGARESASASAWNRSAHRLGKFLHRFTDIGAACAAPTICAARIEEALAFEPSAQFRVLALKSLDAFEQVAGSGSQCAFIAGGSSHISLDCTLEVNARK